MVISVARYAVQYVDDYQGTSIQTWVFPRDRDAGFYDFARAKRPLAFFSSHIGPYSYEKLANVQVTKMIQTPELKGEWMVTDCQVRKLMKLLNEEQTLSLASAKSLMAEAPAGGRD